MVASSSIELIQVTPLPIRVHTGKQKRGRKLSDRSRMALNAALRDIFEHRSEGRSLSVRDAAEIHNVPKSTLHRYLRNSTAPTPVTRPEKLGIEFLLSPPAELSFQPPSRVYTMLSLSSLSSYTLRIHNASAHMYKACI
eukprot:IDg19908t1